MVVIMWITKLYFIPELRALYVYLFIVYYFVCIICVYCVFAFSGFSFVAFFLQYFDTVGWVF